VTADFKPNLTTLPASQRRLWDELEAVPSEFVLYGGTALALYLAHRQSIDFDFFGNLDFDPAKLAAKVPFLASAVELDFNPSRRQVATISISTRSAASRLSSAINHQMASRSSAACGVN
jgi:hypothetical protein